MKEREELSSALRLQLESCVNSYFSASLGTPREGKLSFGESERGQWDAAVGHQAPQRQLKIWTWSSEDKEYWWLKLHDTSQDGNSICATGGPLLHPEQASPIAQCFPHELGCLKPCGSGRHEQQIEAGMEIETFLMTVTDMVTEATEGVGAPR